MSQLDPNAFADSNIDTRHTQGFTTMTTRQQKPIASFLTDLDLHLFNEGSHERIYEKLGAHPRTVDGVTGINFAVWAPNAKQVSVVGGFNYWNNTEHLMHKRIPSGIWELFVPNLKAGEIYKYCVTDPLGKQIDKADPYGTASEPVSYTHLTLPTKA